MTELIQLKYNVIKQTTYLHSKKAISIPLMHMVNNVLLTNHFIVINCYNHGGS